MLSKTYVTTVLRCMCLCVGGNGGGGSEKKKKPKLSRMCLRNKDGRCAGTCKYSGK